MEFILVIAIIAVLCVIFQVSTDIIIMGIAILAGFVITAMTILFIYFFVRLLFSKKVTADFSRIDKQEKTKFRTAYYIIDGMEYPCVFPAESIMTNTLYKKDKKYNVWINHRMKCVYDRFAFTTCVMGFLVSISVVTAVVILYLTV
ncbi:MAG: hypothetical protein NC205_06220 [Prevotella sp.]|nr:hypothetical protein [Alistipes senegalensis]MCM1358173.1 hypothetical protein [Prevotella sp.]MCM1473768.1 hypothetical protein [Muribaculaceae bacterium]MDE6425503.1 hypothetical protein [Ruminococcus sp.]